MESLFRHALCDWLRADNRLMAMVNAVEEEGPLAASPPGIAIAASAASDWSHKSGEGRDLRVAFEILDRSDDPSRIAGIAAALELRVATFAPSQGGFRVVATRFLRSRAERRARSLRAQLLEYRFLILATATE